MSDKLPEICECCQGTLTKLRDCGRVYAATCKDCKLTYWHADHRSRAPRCPVCGVIAIRVDNEGKEQFFVHTARLAGGKNMTRWGHRAPMGGFVDYILNPDAPYEKRKDGGMENG